MAIGAVLNVKLGRFNDGKLQTQWHQSCIGTYLIHVHVHIHVHFHYSSAEILSQCRLVHCCNLPIDGRQTFITHAPHKCHAKMELCSLCAKWGLDPGEAIRLYLRCCNQLDPAMFSTYAFEVNLLSRLLQFTHIWMNCLHAGFTVLVSRSVQLPAGLNTQENMRGRVCYHNRKSR